MYSKSEIAQAELLGSGANRYCVISPRDNSICLKIDLPFERKKTKNWRQSIQRYLSRNFNYFNENFVEWRAAKKLHKLVTQEIALEYIAPIYSLDESELGWILSTELVRNEDGTVAKSLHHHICENSTLSKQQLYKEIDKFCKFLLEYRIPLFDLNSGNIVIQHSSKGMRLYCVDIKSIARGKEIIPISYWSNRLMKKKILRRADRLKQVIKKQG